MTNTTRPRRRARLTGRLALALLLLAIGAGGCIPGSKKAEPTMTPDQATQKMIETLTAAMADVVPGFKLGLPDEGVFCGGPVGTDSSSIQSSVIANSAGPGRQRAVPLVAEALTSHGIKVEKMHDAEEPELPFQHKAFNGSVIFRTDGSITVIAETPCLKNPDRS